MGYAGYVGKMKVEIRVRHDKRIEGELTSPGARAVLFTGKTAFSPFCFLFSNSITRLNHATYDWTISLNKGGMMIGVRDAVPILAPMEKTCYTEILLPQNKLRLDASVLDLDTSRSHLALRHHTGGDGISLDKTPTSLGEAIIARFGVGTVMKLFLRTMLLGRPVLLSSGLEGWQAFAIGKLIMRRKLDGNLDVLLTKK
jgi:hypothetical protein